MTNTYIQTVVFKDICSGCGVYRAVFEVRKVLGHSVVASLCESCLKERGYA